MLVAPTSNYKLAEAVLAQRSFHCNIRPPHILSNSIRKRIHDRPLLPLHLQLNRVAERSS
jgi:hypothetical protein